MEPINLAEIEKKKIEKLVLDVHHSNIFATQAGQTHIIYTDSYVLLLIIEGDCEEDEDDDHDYSSNDK